jgi:hypothetical protein
LEKGEGGEKASMDFLGITCWREREREREREMMILKVIRSIQVSFLLFTS